MREDELLFPNRQSCLPEKLGRELLLLPFGVLGDVGGCGEVGCGCCGWRRGVDGVVVEMRLWRCWLWLRWLVQNKDRTEKMANSKSRSPSESHIFPLYNGFGLTTHQLVDIAHLRTLMV